MIATEQTGWQLILRNLKAPDLALTNIDVPDQSANQKNPAKRLMQPIKDPTVGLRIHQTHLPGITKLFISHAPFTQFK